VTEILSAESGVEIVRQEVTAFPPEGTGIIATGPLTSDALGRSVAEGAGSRGLFFYDAIAPIVTGESIDFGKAFRASRYGKGGDDYVNCPMTEEMYRQFVAALIGAERVAVRDFERRYLFEGCLPVEEMADRGPDTLAFGPLKPVGLIAPETGRQPHAVVQLRQENEEGTLYNLVGFQTRLRQGEQTRVFRMIPGLENAEFVRWGAIHRNTFIDSPRLLTETLQLRPEPRLFFAGQITGVEGYMESTAMGLLAGINGLRWARKEPLLVPPAATLMGGLVRYVSGSAVVPFQPMNANFGLLPPLEGKIRGREKKGLLSRRALDALGKWKEENGL
jgi:methylenetetrahydrofolate--tRNA-(uracil-5-)-methyltransferase